MRELFPYTFGHTPTWFTKASYAVIFSWLETEIEQNAELRLPILVEIVGHRNREVHNFVRAGFEKSWDAEITLQMYGSTKVDNVNFVSQKYGDITNNPQAYAPLQLVPRVLYSRRHCPLVTQTRC